MSQRPHWKIVQDSSGSPVEVPFQDWCCHVVMERYTDGDGLCLRLVDAADGSSIARATVNVPGFDSGKDEILIKDYSENAGVLDALIGAGLVTDTGRTVPSEHAVLHRVELSPQLACQWEAFRNTMAARPPSRGR